MVLVVILDQLEDCIIFYTAMCVAGRALQRDENFDGWYPVKNSFAHTDRFWMVKDWHNHFHLDHLSERLLIVKPLQLPT